jgi:hypothetical protein
MIKGQRARNKMKLLEDCKCKAFPMAYNKSHAMEYDLYAAVCGSYVMKTDKYCKGTFFHLSKHLKSTFSCYVTH